MSNLATLTTKSNNLDVGKLKAISADLSKLINIVNGVTIKKLSMGNCLPKSVLLIFLYQVLVD